MSVDVEVVSTADHRTRSSRVIKICLSNVLNIKVLFWGDNYGICDGMESIGQLK